jgi:hypothetical protein
MPSNIIDKVASYCIVVIDARCRCAAWGTEIKCLALKGLVNGVAYGKEPCLKPVDLLQLGKPGLGPIRKLGRAVHKMCEILVALMYERRQQNALKRPKPIGQPFRVK